MVSKGLVAEDDPLMQRAYQRVARILDYDVTIVGSAEEALKLLGEDPNRFSYLITDYNMPPGMDGGQLARVVDERYPHLPICVASGNANVSNDPNLACLEGKIIFMPKPFSPTQFKDVIDFLTGHRIP